MSNTIKYYLAAYNLIAFVSWLLFLISFCASGLVLNPTALLLLNIAQGLAVLEILHVLLKWVRSPLASTFLQVLSRIMILVFINIYNRQELLPFIFTAGVWIVSFAWGITELIRYSLYLLQLFDKQPKALLWMRYSFFIFLYPIGVTGEWFILLSPTSTMGITINPYTVFLLIAFIAYLVSFPKLYMYMLKQRGLKLG